MTGMNYENDHWALIYDQFNTGRHGKELSFYLSELSGTNDPVLEVACGTGMILLPLLNNGLDAYGFDCSHEMLQQLFLKPECKQIPDIRDRVTSQNMVDFSYDRKFKTIIIPARSFLHLMEQEDQVRCLRRIHEYLAPHGRLLLNFFNPSLSHLTSHSGAAPEYEPFKTFTHPDSGKQIMVDFRQHNDLARQVQDITWRFTSNGENHETRMCLRWIYKEEFQLLLRLGGFSSWELYGNFDKSAFTAESPEMIWVVKKT